MPDLPDPGAGGIDAVAMAAAAGLPLLSVIWDCDMVEQHKALDKWKCLRCNIFFKPHHSARAIYHCAKRGEEDLYLFYRFQLTSFPVYLGRGNG